LSFGFRENKGKKIFDQITTDDKKRLQDKIGSLSSKDMMAIEKAVKIQLGLPL
jgi:mRNA-degrading endonuclease toxin of MazEF toxin-antitoxin module